MSSRFLDAPRRVALTTFEWNLPDVVLAAIWRLTPNEVARHRRSQGEPNSRWSLPEHRSDPVFLAAKRLEEIKASRVLDADGDPHAFERRDIRLSVCVECWLNDSVVDDDIVAFDLAVSPLGSGPRLCATLETYAYKHPLIINVSDEFALSADDRDRLVLALYREIIRYFGAEGDMTVRWVEWIEPDLCAWVRANIVAPAEGRIISALLNAKGSSRWPRAEKRVTESLLA